MNDQVVKKPGKKEGRSPGYPSINLEVALSRAQTLKDKEPGRHYAHISTVFGYWGYGPQSSTGLLALAALKKFGLIEDRGAKKTREARVTDLAWRILEDNRPNSPERAALIQEAALKPPIHRKLWDEYKGKLPSDETLRYRLRITEKFTLGAVDDFIREFKDTIAFAKLTEFDKVPGQEEETITSQEEPMPPATQTSTVGAVTGTPIGRQAATGTASAKSEETRAREIVFPLSRGKWIRMQLPEQLTPQEWDQIKTNMDVFKAGFMVEPAPPGNKEEPKD